MKKFFYANILSLLPLLSASPAFAQETFTEPEVEAISVEEDEAVVIPPLFEYVMAPDDMPDLQSRTDYLMDHFWDPFDFKNTTAVDQNALNHAFGVYVQAMPYASPKKVTDSVKKLIGKIKSNPGLSFQFAKAAEENLFGQRADYWIDDFYIDFIENLLNNKKVRDSQKKHFASQLEMLKRNAIGSPLPAFSVVNVNGTPSTLTPQKEFVLIEIVQPENADQRYTMLKMDISGVLNDLIEEGRLEIDVVNLADSIPSLNYPEKWNVFVSDQAGKVFDLRKNPSFYVISSDGKIAGKNLDVDEAINLIDYLSKSK